MKNLLLIITCLFSQSVNSALIERDINNVGDGLGFFDPVTNLNWIDPQLTANVGTLSELNRLLSGELSGYRLANVDDIERLFDNHFWPYLSGAEVMLSGLYDVREYEPTQYNGSLQGLNDYKYVTADSGGPNVDILYANSLAVGIGGNYFSNDEQTYPFVHTYGWFESKYNNLGYFSSSVFQRTTVQRCYYPLSDAPPSHCDEVQSKDYFYIGYADYTSAYGIYDVTAYIRGGLFLIETKDINEPSNVNFYVVILLLVAQRIRYIRPRSHLYIRSKRT